MARVVDTAMVITLLPCLKRSEIPGVQRNATITSRPGLVGLVIGANMLMMRSPSQRTPSSQGTRQK